MVNEIVVGEIGNFGGDIMFISKDQIFDLASDIDVEVGDMVIGFIKKRNVTRRFDVDKKILKEFQLIAKTKRQNVGKGHMARTVIKFVNHHRYDLANFYEWVPLNYTSIFSHKRNQNLIYARHLYIFLSSICY